MIRIGTAGWAIPAACRDAFPGEGPQLARYAQIFSAVEINSSFHRSHKTATYRRWAASVGEDFRFSVKLPKTITHQHRLSDVGQLLDLFVENVSGLGQKLAVVLVQLPPSLGFVSEVVSPFLDQLRSLLPVQIVIEPRHPSWFEPGVDAMLADRQVARVVADPALIEAAGRPGGWTGIVYMRLHGSPRTYWSSYQASAIAQHQHAATAASQLDRNVWVIYDNTASGAATGNALMLSSRLAEISTS